jgi:hypothetical protein
MAILTLDSFDWMNGTLDSTRYNSINGTPVSNTTNAFESGIYKVDMGSSDYIQYDVGDQSGGGIYYVSCFYRIANAGTSFYGAGNRGIFMMLGASQTAQLWLTQNADGKLELYRGTTTSLGVSNRRLLPDSWYHIELKFAIKNSTASGDIELRIDGTTHMTLGAGVDTQALATDEFNYIRLAGNSSASQEKSFAYFAFNDDSGSWANSFLGPTTRMEVIYPTGNGNYADFTGSDADSTDNYLHVDEGSADDDTSYVESSTVTDRDSYTYGNLSGSPASGNIDAIQLLTRARKAGGAESRDIQQFVRISSTDYDQASHSLTEGTYESFPVILTQNPNTAARWTGTQIDALEAGIEVSA